MNKKVYIAICLSSIAISTALIKLEILPVLFSAVWSVSLFLLLLKLLKK